MQVFQRKNSSITTLFLCSFGKHQPGYWVHFDLSGKDFRLWSVVSTHTHTSETWPFETSFCLPALVKDSRIRGEDLPVLTPTGLGGPSHYLSAYKYMAALKRQL